MLKKKRKISYFSVVVAILSIVLFFVFPPKEIFSQALSPGNLMNFGQLGAGIGQYVTTGETTILDAGPVEGDGSLLGALFEMAMKALMYVVSFIAGFLFWIGAQLVAFFLSLNTAIFDMPLVEVGWIIVRDVANLGFVLAIIVIAVATIVRYKEYGAKQLLFRLIAAAILVNFSLVIAGVFIDFSHTLTNFFVSKSSDVGTEIGLTTSLAKGFDVQKFLRTKAESGDFVNGRLSGSIAAILSLSMAALFTFISAVSLLGIAIMLLTRFIYLSVLLVVSPIVYLFWVIPDTQSIWKSWWRKFFEWVFNAPILTSFLYLAVISTKKIGEFGEQYAGRAGSSISDQLSLTPNILIVIGQSLIMTGLIVGGLITANKMGITGADTAYKLASSAGKTTKKWASEKRKGVGRKIITSGADSEGKTALERFGAKYGKTPLIGRAITGISGLSSKAKAIEKKGVDDYMKDVDKRTGEDSVNIIKRAKTMSDGELAAWSIRAIKEGKLDDIKKNGDLERCVMALRKTGSGDKVFESAPQLAGMFVDQKDKDKVSAAEAKATMKLGDVPKNIDNDFLERNAKYLSSQMIDKLGTILGKKGDDTRSAVKRGLEKDISVSITNKNGSVTNIDYSGIEQKRDLVDEITKNIEEKVGEIRTLKANRDAEKDQTKKDNYNKDIKDKTEELQKIEKQRRDEKDSIKEIEEEFRKKGILDSLRKLDKIEENPNYK